MGKWLGAVFSAAIAASLLAVGLTTPVAGSSGNDNHNRTIRADAVVTELNLINVSPNGPSLGDEIVFAEKLLQGQDEVGHEGAVCTTVSLVRQEAQCIATYSFGGGQITAQALIILGSTAPYAVSITGGTGEYVGAKGVIQVTPISGTTGTLAFYLEG